MGADKVYGFKEWQVICDALASGRQTVILRKGGIHEGRDGFSFAHQNFFLFPTKFHAQLDQVTEGNFTPGKEWETGDLIELKYYAEIQIAVTIEDESKLVQIAPWHIYSDDLVKERFDWSGKGMDSGSIHCALVKTMKLLKPWVIPYEKRFGGCRSWLELPQVSEGILASSEPVITSLFLEKQRDILLSY